MKQTVQLAALLLVLTFSVGLVRAQEMKGIKAELIGQISYAQKEIMELEQAIPDAKMSWRPNKDVRSISEVYLHIAGANYLFGGIAGITVPEGTMMKDDPEGKKWESSTTDKKVIAEKLETSFAYLKDGIKNLPEANLDKSVSFFGNQMTVRALLITALGHMHEHLGQSIAYARTVDVVPPWTAREMAAAKAKKDKKD